MDTKNPAFAEGISRPPSRIRTRSETVKDTLEDHGVLLRHLILTINGGTDPESSEEVQGLNHFIRTGMLQIFNETRALRQTVQELHSRIGDLEAQLKEQRKKDPFSTPPNPKPEEPTPRAGTSYGMPQFANTTTPRDPPPHPTWGAPRARGRNPSSQRTESLSPPRRTTRDRSQTRGRSRSPKSKMPQPDAYEGKRGVAARQYFTKVLAYFDANE